MDPLTEYLRSFLVAWKQAHRLWVILQDLERKHDKKFVDNLLGKAVAESWPLFPVEGWQFKLSTCLFLRNVSPSFSDWVFNKEPDCERFERNVLAQKERLFASPDLFEGTILQLQEDVRVSKSEIKVAFGRSAEDLKAAYLFYQSSNRQDISPLSHPFGVKVSRRLKYKL